MKDALPSTTIIPGEIARKHDRILVSNAVNETEDFFNDRHMIWTERQGLELEEIVTIMLSRKNSASY